MKSTELKQERARVWEEMKGLHTRAEEGNRDLTAEESTQWETMEKEVQGFTERINRAEEAEQRDRDFAVAADPAKPAAEADDAEMSEEEKAVRSFLKGERRDVTFNFGDRDIADFTGGYEARKTSRERRDLTAGSAAAGGNTVPISFVRRLYEHLIEESSIRQTNVNVITTTSGEELRLPKTTAHGAAAAIVAAEGDAFTEGDPTFGQLVLNSFKYGKLLQISSELVEDTAVDLLGYIARDMGRAIARGTSADYVVGNGVNKPNGVVTASSLGVTAAATAAVTADELIDLFYSVIRPYRANGTWLMRDSTIGAVRKLKETTGQYIWQPGLTGGEPDRILGRPLYAEPNMDGLAAAKKVIAFGDFSTYVIRDVGAVELRRSDDFAFDKDLITYRVRFRTDGDQQDTTGAIKHLITHA